MNSELSSTHENVRIIVVDDDESIRRLVVTTLEEAEVTVLQAGDAEEALALLRENPRDLAVLDRNLPGMQGAELYRALRSAHGGEFLQILMLTAEHTPVARLDCFDCGADDFVAKPKYFQISADLKFDTSQKVHGLSINLKLLNKNRRL